MTSPETSEPLVALNLAFPAAIEEELIDFCHAHNQLIAGFTLLAAEGFGAGASLHSAAEVVLGRAKRRLLTAVVPIANVDSVLTALHEALPSPEIVYWTTSVERFGRLR